MSAIGVLRNQRIAQQPEKKSDLNLSHYILLWNDCLLVRASKCVMRLLAMIVGG